MILALFLFGSVLLHDDTYTIPPRKWRYDRFVTTEKQLPVHVDCRFHTENGQSVRVELLTGENLDALRAGKAHETIAASRKGSLHQEIGVPGTFAIVVINEDSSASARVALRLSLDFSARTLNVPRTLSPERKLTVILLSFVGFIAMVTVSGRWLLKAMFRPPPAR